MPRFNASIQPLRNIVLSAMTLSMLLVPDTTWADGPAARTERKVQKAASAVKENVEDTMASIRVRVGILQHLKTDGVDVSITVDKAVATLDGELETAALRDLAIDVAKNTPGIKSVNSTLTVVPKHPNAPVASIIADAEGRMNDSLLEAHVKMKLLEQNGKPALDVEVKATDGVVRLLGQTTDAARKETFVNTAKTVSGVKEVHDLMTVTKD